MQKTLAQLKSESVWIRQRIHGGEGTLKDILKRIKINIKIANIEKKLVRTAMWLIVSAVILVSGCGTLEGMRQDIHQWTDSPAHNRLEIENGRNTKNSKRRLSLFSNQSS